MSDAEHGAAAAIQSQARATATAGAKAPGRIAFSGDGIEVDAELVAEGLGVPAAQLRDLLRTGAVTSRSEHGVEEDAGRHRLTFFYRGRRLRLIVDHEGRLIRRSIIDVGEAPLSAALRNP